MSGTYKMKSEWVHPEFPGKPPDALTGNRVVESSVCEGNILEYPIFKLSNKEARPNRGKDKNGKPLLVQEDYVSTHTFVEGEGPMTVCKQIRIEADMHHGFPTMFAFQVLVAVIDKAAESNFNSARVPITRFEICKKLGMKSIGGRQYELVDEAVRALNKLVVYFRDAWIDYPPPDPQEPKAPRRGRIHPGERPERLVKGYTFPQELLSRRAAAAQSAPPPESWIELGDALLANLRNGYGIGQDLNYLNELRATDADTAMRLYSYLAKRDGARVHYEEGLLKLAKKLPLKAQKPSHLRRILEPALRVLSEPTPKSGLRFLQEWRFEGEGANTKLVVVFFNPRRQLEGFAASVRSIEQRGTSVSAPRSLWAP